MVFPKQVLNNLSGGVRISGLTKPSVGLFLYEYLNSISNAVLVEMPSEDEAFALYSLCLDSELGCFVYFPTEAPLERVPGFGTDTLRFRKEAIIELSSGRPTCCIGTKSSFIDKCLENGLSKKIKRFAIHTGEEIDREALIDKLVTIGYKRTPIVLEAGTFTARGDIIDVFPMHFKTPFRLSFDYSVVGQISLFDPESQLPKKKQKKIIFEDLSVSQVVNNNNLMGVFPKAERLLVSKDDGIISIHKEGAAETENLQMGVVKPKQQTEELRVKEVLRSSARFAKRYYIGSGDKVGDVIQRSLGGFEFLEGKVQAGFFSTSLGLFVLSENDLYFTHTHKTRWDNARSQQYQDLNRGSVSKMVVGEHLVHRRFGVGIYRGVVSKKEDGREAVEIEYKNNTRVFVSLDQLSLVHKYIGSGKKPSLSQIGSKKWQREVVRTRKAVAEIAQELITLYSNKNADRGFSYTPENELDGEPSRSFSFVETVDQKRAIKEVLSDLDRKEPMDRLVCGDVGFGKTEVAIRAIFKVFLSDRVSIVLCPTTILADQHYITCQERLGSLGIKIALLSRFKSKKEQTQTIKKLRSGDIDVLIGTHRILSKDVEVPKLGLLIVDEEHRFGVKNKEQVRLIKERTDVLSLTATPIPRTLQQSLVGLKNISTIKTPPRSRRPIFTSVKYFNWSTIFTRIETELARQGQVYFLNNDIGSIPSVVDKIGTRFNNHVVAGASGKMPPRELEKTVLGFFNAEVDILVCTTIIESGLDVTNANTIIVKDAQNFGLAQLYQIRGRVGRGGRQASCLLLVPKKKLDKPAQERLRTLEKNTALGSGYNISMSDLEIRGAGSLFGHRQSGHISTIGFNMYCDLLSLEVEKSQGSNPKIKSPPIIKTNKNLEIPEDYIEDPSFRIDYYYRISCAKDLEELDKIEKEVLEIFGPLPKKTKELLGVARLRILFSPTPVDKIYSNNGKVEVFIDSLEGLESTDSFFKEVACFTHEDVDRVQFQKRSKTEFVVILYLENDSLGLEALFFFVKLFDGLVVD